MRKMRLCDLSKVTELVRWQTSDSNTQRFGPKACALNHFMLSFRRSPYLPTFPDALSLLTRLDLPDIGILLDHAIFFWT